MRVYKGECLKNTTIVDIVKSDVFTPDGKLIVDVYFGGGGLNIQTNQGTIFSDLPNCNEIGDIKVTRSDVVSVGWMVVGVLIGAWCIKVLKRGF
jgi:hypothetical protein